MARKQPVVIVNVPNSHGGEDGQGNTVKIILGLMGLIGVLGAAWIGVVYARHDSNKELAKIVEDHGNKAQAEAEQSGDLALKNRIANAQKNAKEALNEGDSVRAHGIMNEINRELAERHMELMSEEIGTKRSWWESMTSFFTGKASPHTDTPITPDAKPYYPGDRDKATPTPYIYKSK